MREKVTTVDSWLIQRLTKPFAGADGPPPSAAYREALLAEPPVPKEVAQMRAGVFNFDYMGSAEFEFGAIPKALRAMARAAGEFESSKIHIKKADVGTSRWLKTAPPRDAVVYLVARAEHVEHAARVVRSEAKHDGSRLKEATRLVDALHGPRRDSDSLTLCCGWFELDNLFWFFTDKAMHDGVCALFGIEVGP